MLSLGRCGERHGVILYMYECDAEVEGGEILVNTSHSSTTHPSNQYEFPRLTEKWGVVGGK